jgi:hypothetical protein
MTRQPPPDARTSVEKRLERMRATDEGAAAIIQAERAARDEKTARLRELRLAKEATPGLPVVDKKLTKRKPTVRKP